MLLERYYDHKPNLTPRQANRDLLICCRTRTRAHNTKLMKRMSAKYTITKGLNAEISGIARTA